MKVGIPREVKNHEYRVAITPAGVHELVRNGHEVFVEHDAGVGSSITNEEYVASGATILPSADDVWATGDLILKVKEPIASEYERMREGQTLFTYLHLAADRALTEELVARKVTGIAYETVELPDRSLPLLAPMSEVAGRMAPQVGAATLQRANGGRGRAHGRRVRRLRRQGRRHRRRRVRHERCGDRPRHAGRGAPPRPQHQRGCGRPTRSTRATCRPSRRTPSRSSGRCSTPTWSSARCWCPAPRRRRWSPTTWCPA